MRKLLFIFFAMIMVSIFVILPAFAVEVVSKTNENGSNYNGWFMDNMPNGFGICTYPDGDMYYGQWAESKRSGFGIYLFSGGGMSAGFWANDKLEGIGMQFGKDQIRYEGYYQNGLPSGDGFVISPDGVMTSGQWENGNNVSVYSTVQNCNVPSFTAQTLANGDIYIGELLNGVMEGYGVCCFTNGGYYVGQFQRGQFTGYGLYLEPQTGGYMAGSFVNGQAQGYATSYYLDGTSYTSWMGSNADRPEQDKASDSSISSDGLCSVCRGMGWCPVCRSGNGTYSNYGFSSECNACYGTGKCWECGGSRLAD